MTKVKNLLELKSSKVYYKNSKVYKFSKFFEGNHIEIIPMPLFDNPQHLQKLRTLFERRSSDGKNLFGLKSIKSFFRGLGLDNQIFLNDLYYYYPRLLQEQQSKLSFEDCYSLIHFIVKKNNCPRRRSELNESFKTFDKGGSGFVNSSDLLSVMKKQLKQEEYEQFSQIVSSSFGPSINYLQILNSIRNENQY